MRRGISERDHAVATLTERADQAATAKQQFQEVLMLRDEQLRQLDIERAQLLAIRDGQDTLLAGLRTQLAELQQSKSKS